MDHGAHLPALSRYSKRIEERLGAHRSRCADRANSPTPAAARDRERGVPPLPASSSTARALTSRPAGERQTPPSPRPRETLSLQDLDALTVARVIPIKDPPIGVVILGSMPLVRAGRENRISAP